MIKIILPMIAALTIPPRTAAPVSVALAAVLCFSTLHAAPQEHSLSWLKSADYSALDRYLTALQRGYESGEVSEQQLYQGFRTLYQDDADNAQYFDGWVRTYPKSYAARTARGAYYYRMGQFVRGDEFISQTPTKKLRAMDAYLALARPDLLASLKLTTTPYLSTLYLLNVARLDGSLDDRRKWLEAGNAIAPNNVLLRLRYINCLTPRWGGSIEMMRSFRSESERRHVSAALLTKFDIIINSEAAYSAAQKGDAAQAFSNWDRILKLSATAGEPPSDKALIGYARSAWELRRSADADRGLGQLAQRQVDDPSVLSQMGWIYVQEKRMADAWRVLQKAASLNDPWAQFSVGKTAYLGCPDINLPANRSAGLVWIRRSANQGFPEAKAFLLAHAF